MVNVTPKITVIIPLYNLSSYIEGCLTSLAEQTAKKESFEVIVVDDCSSDDSFDKVASFSKLENLHLYQASENGGPGHARNIGIARAKGEYLLFLDGDDFLMPHAIQTLCNFCQQQRDPDTVTFNWCYGRSWQVKNPVKHNHYLQTIPRSSTDVAINYIAGNMDGSVIYTLAKSSLFKQHNIHFKKGFHEDFLVIFQLYYHAQCNTVLDQVLYIKNNREDSIVNTLSKKHIDGFFQAWQDIYHVIKSYEPMDNDKSWLMAYSRGINGLVCTMLDRISAIDDEGIRRELKGYMWQTLIKDPNLAFDCLTSFSSESQKDKRAIQYYQTMLEASVT